MADFRGIVHFWARNRAENGIFLMRGNTRNSPNTRAEFEKKNRGFSLGLVIGECNPPLS